MIRITIEMIPKGDDSRAYTLAQGMIANDGTGTKDFGSYIYAFSGQVTPKVAEPEIKMSGTLNGFSRRRDDVWELLRKCLNKGDQRLVAPDGNSFSEDKS